VSLDPADITPASLGFEVAEDAAKDAPAKAPDAGSSSGPPESTMPVVESPGKAPADRGLAFAATMMAAPSPAGKPSMPLTGGTLIGNPAPADLARDLDRARKAAQARAAADEPAPAAPVAVASAPAAPDRTGETRPSEPAPRVPVRKSGTPLLVWVGVAVVAGALAAVLVPSKRNAAGTEAPLPEHPAARAAAAGVGATVTIPASAAREPAADPAPSVARQEVPVSPSALPPSGSPPVGSGAPTSGEAPSPSASGGPAPEHPAAAAPPSADDAASDEAAVRSLQKGYALLYVASPLATNVYVYGLLAGKTNERITTKCGPRFIRLGTAAGAWQGEGVVQVAKCGTLTRIEMSGN